MGDLSKRFDKWLYRYHQYEPQIYHDKFKVPDWKIYKVENAEPLVRVRNALASHGLKDPWLRNDVWRYHRGFGPSTGWNMVHLFTRGIKLGAVLAVSLYTFNNYFFPEEDHHHDGDEHH